MERGSLWSGLVRNKQRGGRRRFCACVGITSSDGLHLCLSFHFTFRDKIAGISKRKRILKKATRSENSPRKGDSAEKSRRKREFVSWPCGEMAPVLAADVAQRLREKWREARVAGDVRIKRKK